MLKWTFFFIYRFIFKFSYLNFHFTFILRFERLICCFVSFVSSTRFLFLLCLSVRSLRFWWNLKQFYSFFRPHLLKPKFEITFIIFFPVSSNLTWRSPIQSCLSFLWHFWNWRSNIYYHFRLLRNLSINSQLIIYRKAWCILFCLIIIETILSVNFMRVCQWCKMFDLR